MTQQGRASQLELLVESVEDYAVFLLDPRGRVTTWNRGAQRIKGYTAEEIVGQHFSRFYTEADRARRHPQDELVVAEREGRYAEEGWRLRKDGSCFWASVVITAVRDAEGTLVGFGKVTRDLTERRRADEQLMQFRRLVAGVRDYAIFLLHPDGRIATWNAGAENIKGWTAEEVVGRHFSLFYTQADRDRRHPEFELEVAGREGRYEEEGWRVRKDGSRFWASVTITAVRDEAGRLTGWSKVTRDLTERKAGEDRLQAARDELQRTNEELERFAVVAAHDLREPLTTVLSYARLVEELDGEHLSPPGRDALGQVSDAVEAMQALIEDLLAYARLGSSAVVLEPVALRPVADRVLHRLAATVAARGAQVRVDVPEDAVVRVDRLGADLLLQNLVSNAVKFGAAGGPRVEVAARRDDAVWELSVADDGAGLAAEDQARVFLPFERVRGAHAPAGQGLGLSICRRVAERSGGSLGVESAPGRGSRFWCRLPAAED